MLAEGDDNRRFGSKSSAVERGIEVGRDQNVIATTASYRRISAVSRSVEIDTVH